jgi:alpha-D-ribose 1-methylphosphonate 5-triphosphate synthase subunit PhnH
MNTQGHEGAERQRIHAIQQSFRAVLDAMARPGLVRVMTPVTPTVLEDPCLETVLAMLCDSSCGFVVATHRHNELLSAVAVLTYAHPVAPAHADFALVCADVADGEAARLVNGLSGGTLLSPERSATVLFQCERLADKKTTAASCGFYLRGPGIATTHEFFASSDEWYQARICRDDEFPRGIDFILFDRCGNVVCVPRTTKVETRAKTPMDGDGGSGVCLQHARSNSEEGR